MTPSHQTAINEKGFYFQLPKLGLDEPAVGWTTMKAGIGTKEAVSALLKTAAPTPLRTPEGEHRVMEIEWQGYVWWLPFLNPLPHQPQPSPEVFTINVRRALVPTVANGVERGEVDVPPGKLEFFIVNPKEQEPDLPDWPPLPTTQGASRADSKLFDICLNPTPAHCQEKAKVHGAKIKEEAGEGEDPEEKEQAWRRWAAMQLDEVNEDWLRGVHRNAVATGLRKKSNKFKENEPLVRLRPEAAAFYDVQRLEYAICKEDGEVSANAKWQLLPDDAYSQDFVRCTINLVRLECRKKLFAREEWPPGAVQKGVGEAMEE